MTRGQVWAGLTPLMAVLMAVLMGTSACSATIGGGDTPVTTRADGSSVASSGSTSASPQAPATSAPLVTVGPRSLESLEAASARAHLAAAGITLPGDAAGAYGWTDANGGNVLLLTVSTDKRKGVFDDAGKLVPAPAVHAALVAHTGTAKPVVLRTLVDPGDPPCGGDLTNEFQPRSVTLSDTDGDSVGEVTVGWAYGCRFDVSPLTAKLVLLEGADKYILRGTGFLSAQEAKAVAGAGPKTPTFSPDPPRAQWPAGAYEHAVAVFTSTYH